MYDHANSYRCLSPQRLCYLGQVSITEAMFFTSNVMTKISTSSKWCLLSSTPTLTIFDRFGLRGYLSGVFLHSTYEGSQLSSMVQGVLYLLITIFSEYVNLQKLSITGSVSLCSRWHFIIYDNRSRYRHRQYLLHHVCWEDTCKIWMNHQIPTYSAKLLEAKPLGITYPKSLNDLFDGSDLQAFVRLRHF